jgi:hypothetical protein
MARLELGVQYRGATRRRQSGEIEEIDEIEDDTPEQARAAR